MTGNIEILPMAITMMIGPQIITAVVLATSGNPGRNSLAFVAGVAGASTVGVAVAYGLALAFNGAVALLGASGTSAWLTYILAGLLVYLSIKTFLSRKTAEPPKWMTSLQQANAWLSLKIGLMLIFFMPSDIIIMLSVGGYLASHDLRLVEATPFILATAFIAALPGLAYAVFRKRAVTTLPIVRDWMNAHSWLISIVVYLFFIYILLG